MTAFVKRESGGKGGREKIEGTQRKTESWGTKSCQFSLNCRDWHTFSVFWCFIKMFWKSHIEDNCVLMVSFLIVSIASCKAIRHKPQQCFKTEENDCFPGQTLNHRNSFQNRVWMCTIVLAHFITRENGFVFLHICHLGRENERQEGQTCLIKRRRYKSNTWSMDWPVTSIWHPQTYSMLTFPCKCTENVKKKDQNKYLSFL